MTRLLAIDAAGRLANRIVLDDPRVAQVLDLLDGEGERARVVGGAVRNALLGLVPGDIDITTTALPEVVTARAKAAKLRALPTGIEHGTVTILVQGLPLEVTTLREDVETDGRHAVVRFGRDFAEDARRRDFTINALSVDRDGALHDTTGGLADLAAGRVRFIGDPAARIREDYLRILRFFRFSARYALGPLDAEGLAACAAGVGGLGRLSRERVRSELLKLLTAERAADVVEAMDAAGVLGPVIGSPCWPALHSRLVAIEQTDGEEPDPLRRLAALTIRTTRDVAHLRDRLRLSNEERDRLTGIAEVMARLPDADAQPPDTTAVLRLLHDHGRAATRDALLIAQAASEGAAVSPLWQAAVDQAAAAAVPALPVSGADLLARGLRPGPLVGAVLKDVQARWIRAGYVTEPAVLHRLIDEALAAVSPPTP